MNTLMQNLTQKLSQKENVLIQNIVANGGVLRSDINGEILAVPNKSDTTAPEKASASKRRFWFL